MHAVVGNGGDREGLTHTFETPSPAWSALRRAELGYARLSFDSAEKMTFELVLAQDGSVGDTFTIERPAGGGAAKAW